MSKISIKTDFNDGEKLFAQDLNNNFLVIQAGINANEENLQEVIDQAIIELDAELEAITADRGWDWNGGNRVTFYKGNTTAINSREIVNGQMLYNTDTGETALDDNGERIITGSGNVVAVGETQPTNPATKLWIDPRKMVKYGASYVVDSMEGTDKDKSPSVNAVKDYVDEKQTYSTTETVIGTWFNKPLYRKVIDFGALPNNLAKIILHNINNVETFVTIRGIGKALTGASYSIPHTPNANMFNGLSVSIRVNATELTISTNSDATTHTAYVILEYTKTTD